MLFLEPLRGIVQEISVVKPSMMLAFTPLAPASIDILFQRPLVGIVQLLEEFKKSHLVFPPVADQVPIDVLFQRPRANIVQLIEEFNKSRLVSVPVPDASPPFPFELFLRPLRAPQYEVDRVAKSMLVDQRLEIVQPPGDTFLFFLRPRSALQYPPPPESESTFIFGLNPFVDILFLRPMRGIVQKIEEFRPAMFVRVPVPDPTPTIDVLFQRPMRSIVQVFEEFRPSAFIRVPVADQVPSFNILFLRPTTGIIQLVEAFRISSFIRIPVPDIPPTPIDVLFQRPRVGFVQFVEVFNAPRMLVVPVPDPVPAVNATVFVVIAGTPGAINIRVLTESATLTRVVIDTTAQKVVVVQDPAAIPVKVVI